jgi:hypothetical protein
MKYRTWNSGTKTGNLFGFAGLVFDAARDVSPGSIGLIKEKKTKIIRTSKESEMQIYLEQIIF